MEYKNLSAYDNHKHIISFELQTNTGVVPGYIALHRVRNGIAIGGTRMVAYSSKEEALADALNLSKGMTHKCIHANLPYGGGKGVIMANPHEVDIASVLSQYAEKVNELGGSFYTGEDVGLDKEAVAILGEHSKYIIGLPNKTGIPAPWAAEGVFVAIQAALQHVFKNPGLEERSFAIKGLGAVGTHLAELLLKGGAKVYGADVDEEKVKVLAEKYKNFIPSTPEKIHTYAVDVYSPCALGYDLTPQKVKELNIAIVCGAANNQLETDSVAELLFQKGIVYVPDYIANAGGLIHVADELEEGGYSENRVQERIKNIGIAVNKVLDISAKTGLNQDIVARNIAAELINA